MAVRQAEPLPTAPSSSSSSSAQVAQDGHLRDGGGWIREYWVISIGLETSLYEQLMHDVPDVRFVTVDVRPYIPSLEPYHRPYGNLYPDPRVVRRIEGHPGFDRAVNACSETLRAHSIVIVGCKSGMYRAPTVAARVRSSNAYTVHFTLQEANLVEAMLVVGTCLRIPQAWGARGCRMQKLPSELCLAWPWTGTRECPEEEIRSREALDSVEEHPDLRVDNPYIRPRGSDRFRWVPSTWLVPLGVIRLATFACG